MAIFAGAARWIETLAHQLPRALRDVEDYPVRLGLGHRLPAYIDAFGQVSTVDVTACAPADTLTPTGGVPLILWRGAHRHDTAAHMKEPFSSNVFHVGSLHPYLHIVWSEKAQAPVRVGQVASVLLGAGATSEQEYQQTEKCRFHRFAPSLSS